MYPYFFLLNIVGYQITDVVQSTSLVTEVEDIKKYGFFHEENFFQKNIVELLSKVEESFFI
jgi:hypothetical protein